MYHKLPRLKQRSLTFKLLEPCCQRISMLMEHVSDCVFGLRLHVLDVQIADQYLTYENV